MSIDRRTAFILNFIAALSVICAMDTVAQAPAPASLFKTGDVYNTLPGLEPTQKILFKTADQLELTMDGIIYPCKYTIEEDILVNDGSILRVSATIDGKPKTFDYSLGMGGLSQEDPLAPPSLFSRTHTIALVPAAELAKLMNPTPETIFEVKWAKVRVNLKSMAIACRIYAADNDDDLPPDLETLVKWSKGFLPSDILINPLDPTVQPGYELTLTKHERDSPKIMLRSLVTGPEKDGIRKRLVAYTDNSVESISEPKP